MKSTFQNTVILLAVCFLIQGCKRRDDVAKVMASGGGAAAARLSALGACDELKPREFKDSEKSLKSLDLIESARLASFLTFEAFNAVGESGSKGVNEKALFTLAAARLGISMKMLYKALHQELVSNQEFKQRFGGDLLREFGTEDPIINAKVEISLASMLAEGTIALLPDGSTGKIRIVPFADAKEAAKGILLTKEVVENDAIERYRMAFNLDTTLATNEASSTKRRVRNIGYTKSTDRVPDLERLLNITNMQLKALGVDLAGQSPIPGGLNAEQKTGAKAILLARIEVFPALFHNAQKGTRNLGGLPGVGSPTGSNYAQSAWLDGSLNEVVNLIQQLKPTSAEKELVSRNLLKAGVRLELAGYQDAAGTVQSNVIKMERSLNVQTIRLEEMILEAQNAVQRGQSVYAAQVAELISATMIGQNLTERKMIDILEVMAEAGTVDAIRSMVSNHGSTMPDEVKTAAAELLESSSKVDAVSFMNLRNFGYYSTDSTIRLAEVQRRLSYFDTTLSDIGEATSKGANTVEVDGRSVLLSKVDTALLQKQRADLQKLMETLNKDMEMKSEQMARTRETLTSFRNFRAVLGRARAAAKKF